MKCPVCLSKKAKRACLLTKNCICSSCCGERRNKESCQSCSFYKEPSRNYKSIERYSPNQISDNIERLNISEIIETAVVEFDQKSGGIMRDALAMKIFECLLDVLYFKDERQPTDDTYLEQALDYVLIVINNKLSSINRDELVKIIGSIYFIAKRRTEGYREYLDFIRQYVSVSDDSCCGLCGNTKKALTKTPCCNNWICDDEKSYTIFSFKRNSCYRNHSRYTICARHYHQCHFGPWQDCKECKKDSDSAEYIYFGTNEYNFEALKNPEKVIINCANCDFTADTIDAFSFQTSQGYYCEKQRCQKAALSFQGVVAY
jgi:hypothetical protein